MFNGSLNGDERKVLIDQFKQNRHHGMLLTLGAAGVGLSLTEANHVILASASWNPQMEHQAEDRVHRIRQNKPVTIYKMIVQG